MLFKLHRLHLILQRMTPYWRALMNTINKVVYTLNEPETKCAISTSDLNSAILGLTDKCLVPLICSGQVKLATVLESFQYKRSDSFGVNPPLY